MKIKHILSELNDNSRSSAKQIHFIIMYQIIIDDKKYHWGNVLSNVILVIP